jgi:hypothetical protein
MKLRVQSLVACLVAVVVICAVGVECWAYFGAAWHLWPAFGMVIVLPFLAALAIYLVRLRWPRVCTLWSGGPGTFRFNRWHAATLISTVVMVLCALLWMRSYHFKDSLNVRVFEYRGLAAASEQGVLTVSFGGVWWHLFHHPRHDDREWRRIWLDEGIGRRRAWIESGNVSHWRKWYGSPTWWTFDFDIRRDGPKPRVVTTTVIKLAFPHWLPLILLGISPAVALFRGLRRCRRVLLGRCLACGYDLTGNVSGRCPECGLDRDPQVTAKHTSGETNP